MDSGLFFGGSVAAAVVAGTIALFAPCCISVMPPAFFATSFHNRRLLTALTFLFAAGIATVILPIALGAAAVRQLLLAGHTPIYVVAGATMLGLAAYTLLGGRPGRQGEAERDEGHQQRRGDEVDRDVQREHVHPPVVQDAGQACPAKPHPQASPPALGRTSRTTLTVRANSRCSRSRIVFASSQICNGPALERV